MSRARTPGADPRRLGGGDVLQRGPPADDREGRRRSARRVVIITSDRGLAGAYSSSVLKESERLVAALREEGKEVVPYLVGRKAIGFYKFRQREYADEWSGNSEQPTFETAREVGQRLVADFTTPTEDGGVDEVHLVFTRFVSMVTQEPEVIRLLPLEVVEGAEAPDADDLLPLYSFEPSAEQVLDALLPKYVNAPALQLHAPGRRLRARRPPAGDEVGHGQRRGAHQEVHPAGQPGPPGRDHPRDQRNRRRRQRAGREQVRR